MTQILDQIKQEPDLQDFIEYCRPILQKVENIQKNLESFSIQNKVKNYNIDVSYKIESIINKHLYNSIKSYLNLTFEYRNTKKIDINGQKLTPKEALLLNLNHISQQVNQIEEEFNEENKIALMVQNRLLRQMPQTEPLSENNFINQFDINNFKKEVIENHPIPTEKIEAPKIINNTQDVQKPGSSIESIVGVIISIFLIIGFISIFKPSIHEAVTSSQIEMLKSRYNQDFKNLTRTIPVLESSGVPISTQSLQSALINNSLIKNFVSISRNSKQYSITLAIASDLQEPNVCKSIISSSSWDFNEIKAITPTGEVIIKQDNPELPDTESIYNLCENATQTPFQVEFIKTKPIKITKDKR